MCCSTTFILSCLQASHADVKQRCRPFTCTQLGVWEVRLQQAVSAAMQWRADFTTFFVASIQKQDCRPT